MIEPYYSDSHVQIFLGDCREILPQLEAGSVQCCISSPPYWNQRDYQSEHQIGLEGTAQEYIAELRGVFGDVRRVLRDDASAWINLGDCFQDKQQQLMPHRVAMALQDDGWWLRSTIVWHKENAMPSSVTDRPTDAHEYIFLLAKAARYYYDKEAIAEPAVAMHGSGNGYKRPQQLSREGRGSDTPYAPQPTRNKRSVWNINTTGYPGAHFAVFPEKLIEPCILAGCPVQVCAACGAPWERVVERAGYNGVGRADATVYAGQAYKTPQSAPRGPKRDFGMSESTTVGWQPTCTCNAATVPGTVIDPFGGSGTTARVAKRLGRRCIIIEQRLEYCEMAAASLSQSVMDLVLP